MAISNLIASGMKFYRVMLRALCQYLIKIHADGLTVAQPRWLVFISFRPSDALS